MKTEKKDFIICSLIISTLYFLIPIGCNQNTKSASAFYYKENQLSFCELALRFAPRLYIHPKEPYEIMDIVIIIHDQKPIISYHFVWEDDAISPKSGHNSDHEIAWIEYDPVSLNVVNVWSIWHRSILNTYDSIEDAKANGQRPAFFVQWGQHGLLPVGWEKISTAKLSAELHAHYAIVKTRNLLRFQGDYSDYITFSKITDSRKYINPKMIISAEDSNKVLKDMLPYKFRIKKPWPY